MKLSISNIGWTEENDRAVYELMQNIGYEGLEVAPTRIFSQMPYDRLEEAQRWARTLKQDTGLIVPSTQSIWYGREEKIFGTEAERNILIGYTKKAIDFASVIGCRNLVFGCPRNRNIVGEYNPDVAIGFFREIGDYAADKETVIGMEANPPIYNTNYINNTKAALELIEQVGSDGFKLNFDLGTVIYNEEDLSEIVGKVKLINHVHISEPGLKPIEKRSVHEELRRILVNEDYNGFVSIEMGKSNELTMIEDIMLYVKEIFS